ncbi:hypothetical protein JW823_05170 [bacterium]|nr:hypothetical protein [candidate division CSSED10-310 bacterium]
MKILKSGIWITLGLLLALASATQAFDVYDESSIPAQLLIPIDPNLNVSPSVEYFSFRDNQVPNHQGILGFFEKFGHHWDIQMDRRNNRPELISGRGIPLIPGAGNDLTMDEIRLNGQSIQSIDRDSMIELAKNFLQQNPDVLNIDMEQLVADYSNTRGYENDRIWFVHFTQVIDGITVKDSDVFFRINSGNITQFGAYRIVDPPEILITQPLIESNDALDIAINHTLTACSGDLDIVMPPELFWHPIFGDADTLRQPGEIYDGPAGEGYALRLAWEMKFRMEPEPFTWHALIDAFTGDILSFRDDNKYEAVYGGVYPITNLNPEVVLPFPFVATSAGNTTSGGRFTSSGSTSTTLNGQYVRISDDCGSVSLSSAGDLDFGMSSGQDCTTPGFGGSGNTHSSRSCFYHLSQIKFKARGYLTTNSWLQGNVRANLNIDDTCNAYWDGSSVNFFKSGGGCSNTGEISSVFLHEWGHGLDYNTGTSSSEMASAEALADSMSFLQTHDPCIGHNFRPGVPCSFGCDSSCTGVRGMNVRPLIRPSNIHTSPASCARWSCPYSGYEGIMGYEGHCEALIAGGAVWDVAQNLSGLMGDAGWELANRIYFQGMGDYRGAYQLVSGGQCNPNATINGCGSQNWYTVWIFIDDDNGNLTDGTPHAQEIWNGYNDHGIACGTLPVNYSVCPSLATPGLNAAPGDDSATLSWNSVPNASQYILYRNTIGCDFAMNIVSTTSSTTYVDNTVANDFTYYYAVQAVGSNSQCRSSFSDCIPVEINACINPPIADAGTDIDACPGDPVSIGGNPTASGGTPPFTYLWTPGNFSSSNPTVYPNQTTTYTVVVTDNLGCIGMDSVTVTMDAPIVNAGFDQFTCASYCVQLGSAPVQGYTYSWTPTQGLSNPSIANPVACVDETTVYTLTVTASGYLCQGQDQVSVIITLPALSVENVEILSDSGDSDGFLEAGERGLVRAYIANVGMATAHDVEVFIADTHAGIYPVDPPQSIGDIAFAQSIPVDFEIIVDQNHDCPVIESLEVGIMTCGGSIPGVPMDLVLGQPGGTDVFYFTGFEGPGDEGWTHAQVQTQDDWQRDIPQGTSPNDPSSAYEGQYCWGNDMGLSGWDGDYKNNVANYLLSPSFNCTGKTGIHLQFMRWLTVEEGIYDQATVKINNQTIWQNQNSGHHLDSSWTFADYDISAYADDNPAVQIRFDLTSDAGLVYGGWNIDNLALITDLPPECDSFECISAQADAGSDQTVNPGTTVTLNASGSNITGCVSGIEYQWIGGQLPGTWSENPIASDIVSSPVTYVLNIRCMGGPEVGACNDTDSVTIYINGEQTPTAVPPTSTPAPNTATPTPTQTPSSTPTAVPTHTPTPLPPTATPTPTTGPGEPTNTPIETHTPTPVPTSTPSEFPITISVTLSKDIFRTNDFFSLQTHTNNTSMDYPADEYLMLDVYGMYWFFPGWTQELNSNSRVIPEGEHTETIMEFVWPQVQGSAYNLHFYYLLTKPSTFQIVSNLAMVTFGYE